MNKIKRSGRLLKASFAILLRERRLLLFPVIVTALTAVVALFFISVIAFQPTGFPYTSASHWHTVIQSVTPSQQLHVGKGEGQVGTPRVWVAPVFALIYFVSMFLATFCNVAFYHEIMQALNGQAVSIGNGFRFAVSRWRSILMWSLFAGVVGYLIRTIQERVGLFGKIITGIIGFVWSTACIFIIPTLICGEETVNPVKVLRRSASTLKSTWGELIIGFVGVEMAFGLIFLAAVFGLAILGGGAAYFVSTFCHFSPWWVLPFVIVAMVLVMVSMGLVGSVVNPVYRCALYIYAVEGVIPESFDKELLDSAWKVK